MKDDMTMEQKERLQQQDEFLTAVKNAKQGGGKKKVNNYREYPAPKNKLEADMQKSDRQEFNYQMKKSGVSHSIIKETKVKDDGKPQGKLMRVMKKRKTPGQTWMETKRDNPEQNKKDLNDENIPIKTNPKYQSKMSDRNSEDEKYGKVRKLYRTGVKKSLEKKNNPVDDAIKIGGSRVRKILEQ